jgi:multidrug resistance efflux pump
VKIVMDNPPSDVALEIDAYPGRTIRGHVDSVQPGSGTAFSLLPAQNATGNYVKIVQRALRPRSPPFHRQCRAAPR